MDKERLTEYLARRMQEQEKKKEETQEAKLEKYREEFYLK